MNQALPLLAVTAVLLVGGCPSDGTRPGTPIDVTRITPDAPSLVYHSQLGDPLRTAIFDAATFTETWNRAFASRDPLPEVPAVDFATEFVVVAALGERSSGGYAIEVAGAVSEANGVVVGIKATAPGKGCPVSLALTQPLDIVKLKRPSPGSLPVRFEERLVSTDCGP
jgi:hypothetical protein